jgi:hypothetical protein
MPDWGTAYTRTGLAGIGLDDLLQKHHGGSHDEGSERRASRKVAPPGAEFIQQIFWLG